MLAVKKILALFAAAAFAANAAEIEFANPLPRMRCGEVKCGTYNNGELSLPGVLTTSDARLGMFLQKMRETIMANRRLHFVDGRVIVCNHNWIRDHVHTMKGFKHWEYDPISYLQFIIDTQRADDQFFELVKQMDDYHWKMVDENCRRLFPADSQSLVRLELEADVEYLVVEGAWQYYRMTGDDKWLASVLPSLEKGHFLSIRCTRKLHSDAHAGFNRMYSATCIGWKLACQSDAPLRFNPLHFRVSIH